MRKTVGRVVFARSSTTAIGVLLLVLFWNAAPALGQAPSPFQVRVTGVCGPDSSISQINQNGTVVCEPTPVGTCPVGYFISAINTNGTLTCALDSDGGGTVTGVTASGPLHSTEGTTPNISLPHVRISVGGGRTTAIGFSALSNNDDTIASDNTASGFGALESNTTGISNTANGSSALESNNGSYNTASGYNTLALNTTGEQNTAMGALALSFNTTGKDNTAIGFETLLHNKGDENTASGLGALFNNVEGGNNTASGSGALTVNITGSFNTALGSGANVLAPALTNATAIGANAVVEKSNTVRIGDASVTSVEWYGGFNTISDKNLKEYLKPVDGEEVLNKLRQIPVQSWNYIRQNSGVRHYGPVAQDFFAAFGDDGIGTIGTATTIGIGDMAGILMAAIKELEKRTAQVTELEARLKSLERLIQDRH